MKKVLSLVLVIAMVLSSFSFAFAAKFEDVTGDYEEAVDTLAALGVIRGYEDGTFRPERVLTRAELAVLLVQSLGYEGLVAGSKSNFTDTQNHWSDGYVAIAAGTGLVLGYPDGTFRPDQGVSYDEAITMVLRAIGYVDSALKGTWPTNFKVKAIDLDLLDDVNMATAAADRGGVAQILYNALELPMMELGEENVLVKVSPAKLFIDNIAKPDTITVTKNTINPDHKDYAGDVVDLEPYMFETLSVYLNKDKDVVYVKGSESLVLEGTVDKVEDSKVTVKDADDDKTTVTVKTEEKDGKNAVDVPVYKNGALATIADIEDLEATETIKVVAFEVEDSDTEDGEIDTNEIKGIVITQQTRVAQIAKAYVEGKAKIDKFVLPVDDDDEVDLSKVKVTGAVDSLEDIKKDDIVVEYAAKDGSTVTKTLLVVSRETVEGKITRVNSDETKFYINGTAYEVNALAGDDVVAFGDNGTFFLDHNGDIVAFDGNNIEPTDYAVVVDLGKGKIDENAFGKKSIKDYPLIKLATADNKVVTYELYLKYNSTSGELTENAEYVDVDSAGVIIIDGIAKEKLVKYALNDEGQIEVIEEITNEKPFNTDSSSFVLADDAVIFDGTDPDFGVVNEDMLSKEGTAFVEYNNDGEIVAMLTDDLKEAADKNYAYITKSEKAYNEDDDEVRFITAYVNGKKIEYLTDDKDLLATIDDVKVYTLAFDGEVIVDADVFAGTTTSGAIQSISTATNSVKLGNVRYFLTDDTTILDVDGTTYTLLDLYDIDDEVVTLYLNAKNEVVFIVK